MYARQADRSRALLQTVPTTCMLLIASTLNMLHLFSQTRTYQLHRRSRADPVSSTHATFVPSPRRDPQVVSDEPAPRSTFAGRIAGLLQYMLLVLWRVVVSVVGFLLGLSSASPSTSSPPQGAPTETVQQLEMWIPGELERRLLAVYSPAHALLWICTGSTNWVPMCVVMCVVGVQTGTLIKAYEGLMRDKGILAAEVMHEYNEGVGRQYLLVDEADLHPVCVPQDEPGATGCGGDDTRVGDGPVISHVLSDPLINALARLTFHGPLLPPRPQRRPARPARPPGHPRPLPRLFCPPRPVDKPRLPVR